MNILGINIGHHGSSCLLQDGQITFFIQEERFNKEKNSPLPLKSAIEIIQNYPLDIITWGSPGISEEREFFNLFFKRIAKTYHPNVSFVDYSNRSHHKVHAASAFYNSGFNECIGIVVDGLGSAQENEKKEFIGCEAESVFHCSYPDNINTLYQNIILPPKTVTLGRAYEAVTMHFGWNRSEAGKVMGLAPYGKDDPQIPKFTYKHVSNPQVFYADFKKKSKYPTEDFPQTFIDEDLNPQLKLKTDPREWYHNPSKISEIEKNIAWRIQNDTQEAVAELIEKSLKETGLKKVCCAGGYFLNCVANYYLTKKFPNIDFYFEPIAYDSGTAVGAAQLAYREATKDTTIYPQKTLYYGPQYSKEQLLKGIQKYVSN